MFGRVLSALFAFAGFAFKSIIAKFFVFFALFFVVTEFIVVVVPMLPGASQLSAAFANQASGVWYFLDLFQLSLGVPMCLSAAVTRFIIRRLPVIG